MSTTGRTVDRTGDPPRLVRVTVTRLSGTQPVPWIRNTVAGSPMGWSITICGEPGGTEGNADGGGPGGGPWRAVLDVLVPVPRLGPGPVSRLPSRIPAATSTAAAPVRPAATRARGRRE